MIPDLIYSPKERKFINYISIYENPELEILSEKLKQVEQVLDYIANAIHDNGFTPYIMNHEFLGSRNCPSIRMKYKYNGNVQNINFDIALDQNKVEDIIIKVSFSKDSHRAIDILKTISKKYFIDLVPYTGISTLEELLKIYNGIADSKGYHILPRSTKLQIFAKVTDREYKLLTEWINKGNITRELEINFYSLRLATDNRNDNDDVLLKIINTCKNNKKSLVSLNCNYRVSSTTQDKLNELNEYTDKRKKSFTESITRLVEAYISSKENFEQILHKEFIQLRKDDTLKVFLNFSTDPKIHKMISEKLNSGTKNTANALTIFSIYILEEYTLSDTNVIEKRKDLSKELVEIVARLTQLPLELKVKILKLLPLDETLMSIIPDKVKESKPQEHTTKESDAEAVISDNVLAYDIVDRINTSDQAPEDIPLAGSDHSYEA